MNKLFFTGFLVLISLTGISQDKEERKLGSFDEIKVGQAIKVYLFRSSEEKVVVEAGNVSLDEIETEIDNGRLKISLSGNRYRSINVRVNVYYKSLRAITASSASSVLGEDMIPGDDFAISVSSAASVEVLLDVNQLEVSSSSSGDAKISGRAHEILIDVSSAGSVNAYEMVAEIADISASSAGSARINVTKSLKARASSGGSIRYRGNPQRSNTDSSSGGSVKKAD